MPKYYLTTAIDYSNGDPHLGHALEKIGGDCIARYRRLVGDQVHFVMGMDEHSQSVVQAAARAGVSPREWVDRLAGIFSAYWARLQCSHDDWIRTTEPRHARAVTALLQRIHERQPDHLFVADYEGLYCTGCEEFKQGSQIRDGRCIEHPTLDLIATKERNHFFRLSAYRDRLLALITSGELSVEPAIRRNEVVRLLEGGLQDISVSRVRLPWGIPFPGDSDQTVYVWFDALINYLSATGFPDAEYERLWPADLHVIGKGITRFHCVIWPAMLLAAGVALPRRIWAHGYVHWEGAKLSKTAGVAVSLDAAIERYGADALRYFLLREIGFEGDGDFTWEQFDARYTAELANSYGNLVSRTLKMLATYRGGVVPPLPPPGPASSNTLEKAAAGFLQRYRAAMDGHLLHQGAATIFAYAAEANRFVEERAPWKLHKEDRNAELDDTLAALVRAVARLTVLLAPFCPGKAGEGWAALAPGRPLNGIRWDDLAQPLAPGARVADSPAPILFPKAVPLTAK